MDACAELGLRLELTDDLAASSPLVEHLGRDWQSVTRLVRASQSLIDGDFASATRLVDEARDLGGEGSEAAFFHRSSSSASRG